MQRICNTLTFCIILQCLLNPNEIEVKTRIWMEDNKDYLEKLKGDCSFSQLLSVFSDQRACSVKVWCTKFARILIIVVQTGANLAI